MILRGDALRIPLASGSVDSVVTDPPYGLRFMGKKWDYDVPSVEIWKEIYRVLKPGGHALVFGGTRTYHRMVVNIEDAGFEIRDQLQWLYGSGFPKSLDVSKAIDKEAGAAREVIGKNEHGSGPHKIKLQNHGEGDTGIGYMDGSGKVFDVTSPATESAKQWQGWGTALKPANEPICLARKPVIGTVAENVLAFGTGALNIDGCRIHTEETLVHGGPLRTNSGDQRTGKALGMFQDGTPNSYQQNSLGRWPANVIHDGSEEVVRLFPDQTSGAMKKPYEYTNTGHSLGAPAGSTRALHESNSGSAARFFYCAKASRDERNDGLNGMETFVGKRTQAGGDDTRGRPIPENQNTHPTVKPVALMAYLCRLITPPGGLVLDPFAGSGSTGIAAQEEGFRFVLIEKEFEFCEISKRRNLKPLQRKMF